MWITMQQTYSGPLGLFLKGLTYNLPAGRVKKLPRKSYKKSVAPWDRLRKETTVTEKPNDKTESDDRQKDISSTPHDKQLVPERDIPAGRTK